MCTCTFIQTLVSSLAPSVLHVMLKVTFNKFVMNLIFCYILHVTFVTSLHLFLLSWLSQTHFYWGQKVQVLHFCSSRSHWTKSTGGKKGGARHIYNLIWHLLVASSELFCPGLCLMGYMHITLYCQRLLGPYGDWGSPGSVTVNIPSKKGKKAHCDMLLFSVSFEKQIFLCPVFVFT